MCSSAYLCLAVAVAHQQHRHAPPPGPSPGAATCPTPRQGAVSLRCCPAAGWCGYPDQQHRRHQQRRHWGGRLRRPRPAGGWCCRLHAPPGPQPCYWQHWHGLQEGRQQVRAGASRGVPLTPWLPWRTPWQVWRTCAQPCVSSDSPQASGVICKNTSIHLQLYHHVCCPNSVPPQLTVGQRHDRHPPRRGLLLLSQQVQRHLRLLERVATQ